MVNLHCKHVIYPVCHFKREWKKTKYFTARDGIQWNTNELYSLDISNKFYSCRKCDFNQLAIFVVCIDTKRRQFASFYHISNAKGWVNFKWLASIEYRAAEIWFAFLFFKWQSIESALFVNHRIRKWCDPFKDGNVAFLQLHLSYLNGFYWL